MVFWVFGYGSLVWNPGFEYDEKVIGFIKDYRRVFDLGKFLISIQVFIHVIFMKSLVLFIPEHSFITVSACSISSLPACIDHRGTPEHPARTCTLEYKEGAICVSRT